MEVDRIRYIFGSFTRKRQDKKKSPEQGSISAGNSPLRCSRISRPVSQNLNVAPRTSAYEDSSRKSVVKEWICGLCKKELVEPRLLGCLHSFCTRCLQSLHQEGEAEVWSEIDVGSIQLDPGETASGGGSAASGYESDLRHSGSEASWDQKPHKYGICTRKISGRNVQLLICPECGYETQLPLGGISALPLNYVLLRRMVATVQEYDRANVLCDLCNSDNKAERRCTQCFVSVCTSCGDAHTRHKTTARHSLLPLDPTPTKFCSQHPRIELSVYCATCQQVGEKVSSHQINSQAILSVKVICRDCCLISHSGHALANASRAAAERARLLRDACDRAKHVPENVHRATRNLNYQAVEIDSKAAKVETEVQNWAEEYKRAVEAHGRALCVAAARAREKYRQKLEQKNRELESRAQQAIDAINFAEELMVEATEDELLSLSGAVLRRLERVSELQPLAEAPRCELRFARNAPAAHESTLFGRLLTHAPDPDKCLLNTDGLQDLRVDCQHETILELRDSSGERIWCGGEQVSGYYRRSDSSARPATARVTDRADGTYSIQFTPRSPGAYLLAITLNNNPIKGSPFPCAARVAKAHAGHFHCCTFCSSGGKRDVTCGCGATMPGGYKGCGHGHAGHPGTSHWSCCGSTQRRGLCTNTQSQLYQFSL